MGNQSSAPPHPAVDSPTKKKVSKKEVHQAPPTKKDIPSSTEPAEGFTYEKGVCALSWWLPVKLLAEGSISDIHLVRRRAVPIKVRYKDKRDVMAFAKKHQDDDDDSGDAELYVLKSIMKDHIGDERILEEMRREIFTMSHLDHPNIVKLYEAYERRRHIYLVMEYCPGGNLTGRDLTEDEVAPLIRKILDAVVYMHDKGVVHRDLKLENIMLDRNGEIKIIDFGLATKYLSDEYQMMTDKVGTLYSMAPQVLQGVYTNKCDLWSIGVITYILLSNQQPFWGPPRPMSWAKRRKIMIDRIMRCEYMRMDGPSWSSVSSEAKDFCILLLQMDPDDRPTAKEALLLPWIVNRGYPEQDVHLGQDAQYVLRRKVRKNVLTLLAAKLSWKEIEVLREALERNDVSGEGQVNLALFRDILLEQTALSAEDVASIFAVDKLDLSKSIDFVDLMVEVLRGQGRNTLDALAKELDDCDQGGSRRISHEQLAKVLDKHASINNEVMAKVTVDDDGTVSTIQVLELAGLLVAKCHRDSIREVGNDDNLDGLTDSNTVIPGGRSLSN